MPNRIIVVLGESGSGKDYIVERANTSGSMHHVGWGSLFARIVGEDRDNLTYKPDEARTAQIQQQVMQQVLDLQPVIVTSHPIKIVDGGVHVNWEVERELGAAFHVFVSAPPAIIAERLAERNRTSGRVSPIPGIASIAEGQTAKLSLAAELSRFVGSTLLVLENVDAALPDNIALLKRAIDVTMAMPYDLPQTGGVHES